MKKRGFRSSLSPNGILRWSTACILAGGVAGLTGCDQSVSHVITEKDVEMATTQSQLEKMDSERSRLTRGEVANNFPLTGLGYYHADARDFYPHPYNFSQDGRWFVNGEWQDQPGGETIAATKPTPETLKKVEATLEKEQELAKTQPGNASGNGGFGMGNALMMYWLLAGNRGAFAPGAGFRQAGGQAQGWHQGMDSRRAAVASHAAGNPGYQRMVDQSRATGKPLQAGQSVRGGFGARRSGFATGG
jgi:hypothetical protein